MRLNLFLTRGGIRVRLLQMRVLGALEASWSYPVGHRSRTELSVCRRAHQPSSTPSMSRAQRVRCDTDDGGAAREKALGSNCTPEVAQLRSILPSHLRPRRQSRSHAMSVQATAIVLVWSRRAVGVASSYTLYRAVPPSCTMLKALSGAVNGDVIPLYSFRHRCHT